MAIPLCVKVIVVKFGLVPYPSLCRGDCYFDFVPYLLCRGCYCWRVELCTPKFVLANLSVEVSCVGGPVWM